MLTWDGPLALVPASANGAGYTSLGQRPREIGQKYQGLKARLINFQNSEGALRKICALILPKRAAIAHMRLQFPSKNVVSFLGM